MGIQLGSALQDPMNIALELAQKGQYTTSPNPMVGAVVMKEGRLVGYGYHQYQGDQHAEIKALDMAGEEAKGAILYVTLEPCCHFGQTPPCVPRLIESRIKEVHVATRDPNPVMNGKSIAWLEDAGIPVHLGERQAEAEKLNAAFFFTMAHQKPYVIAKWAMTLNGKMTKTSAQTPWITRPGVRAHTHLLRNAVDAILVGTQTAVLDNPHLTVRQAAVAHVRCPFKVVLDRGGKIPLTHHIFQERPEKTIVVTQASYPSSSRDTLEKKGVTFLEMASQEGLFAPQDLLEKLYALGITRVLLEGGARTQASFLKAQGIQQFYCYIAPEIWGEALSLSPFCEAGAKEALTQGFPVVFDRCEAIEDALLIIGHPKG
jgi:diaminohydroxyphosphoribosylaminopyrimidine deaminase/5-amino-6-(5-phosphoribosylamino)uracil reductase